MKIFTIIKTGLGIGAREPALSGCSGGPGVHRGTVPCRSAALIAAIISANASGGSTINLAAGCTYALTAANNSDPMLGDNGLPVITSPIILNGFRTTIAGNDSTFRIFLVTSTGNLTLQGLTITGGHLPALPAAASSTWRARSPLIGARSPATPPRAG